MSAENLETVLLRCSSKYRASVSLYCGLGCIRSYTCWHFWFVAMCPIGENRKVCLLEILSCCLSPSRWSEYLANQFIIEIPSYKLLCSSFTLFNHFFGTFFTIISYCRVGSPYRTNRVRRRIAAGRKVNQRFMVSLRYYSFPVHRACTVSAWIAFIVMSRDRRYSSFRCNDETRFVSLVPFPCRN